MPTNRMREVMGEGWNVSFMSEKSVSCKYEKRG
jgi:hypothetical protein